MTWRNWNLKAGVRVSGVARYYNCHPSAIQHLRKCYQATRIVKGRHRPGKLGMATDIKTATYVDYIDDIYIEDIRSSWLPTLPGEQQGSKGNLFQIFNKNIFYNNFKSCPISRQISNCSFRIYGYCLLIDCCSKIIYRFDIKFKSCFADILIFIFAKSQ